jgi:prophage antirepressor-like protein
LANTDLTNSNDFTPNNNQLKYLQVYLNQTNESTRTAICQETGITLKTLCEWEKNNNFREWIRKEVDKTTNKHTPAIKLKILEKGLKDNATVQERELALRIANEYTPTNKIIHENTDYEAEIDKLLEKSKEVLEKVAKTETEKCIIPVLND